MNCEILNLLWTDIISYGTLVRLNDRDGLQAWNLLRGILESVETVPIVWTERCLGFYHTMIEIALVEDYDEHGGSISKLEWERHHFLLQHGRIPHRSPKNASIVKLFQIAYNYGQFIAEKCRYPICVYIQSHIDFSEQNKLGNINTYISQDLTQVLCIYITEDLHSKVKTLLEADVISTI